MAGGLVCEELGQPERAATFAAAVLEADVVGGGGCRRPSEHINAHRLRGRLAAATGDEATAAVEFDAALQLAEECSFALPAAQVLREMRSAGIAGSSAKLLSARAKLVGPAEMLEPSSGRCTSWPNTTCEYFVI